MAKQTNQTFLYSHLMRWEPLYQEGGEGRAWIKTLSRDTETGARSVLVKYDPGYKRAKTVSEWPVDIFVLDGGMTAGKRSYAKDTYHFRPAGTEVGPVESPYGVTRLILTADVKDKSSKDEIFVDDVKQMPWGLSYIDPTRERNGVKELRQDPNEGVAVLIHATFVAGERILPGQGHIHDHTEEAFVLEGEFEDYLDDVEGHLYWMPGLYICRVPYASAHGDVIWHKTPIVNLVRRNWTGDMTKFHESDRNVLVDVPRLTFGE